MGPKFSNVHEMCNPTLSKSAIYNFGTLCNCPSRGLRAPMYMKCACAREGGGGREFQNVLNIVHVMGGG